MSQGGDSAQELHLAEASCGRASGRSAECDRTPGAAEPGRTPSSWWSAKGGSEDSVAEQIIDVDGGPGDIYRRHTFLTLRFVAYLFTCALLVGGISGTSVYLWSDMGRGSGALRFLQENERYGIYCAGLAAILSFALYVFDFFAPLHVSGLSESLCGRLVGRAVCSMALVSLAAWSFLMTKTYPTLPIVVTTSLCPVSIMLLRKATMPNLPQVPEQARNLKDRIAMIKMMTWEERDDQNFYKAATYSFLFSGVACLSLWIPWTLENEAEFSDRLALARNRGDQELLFVRWAAPCCVAVSNFVFGSFTLMRVSLNGAYSSTDELRNQMIFGAKSNHDSRRAEHYRIQMLRVRVAAAHTQKELCHTAEDKLQRYLVHHISHMRRLSKTVKSASAALFALIVALHIVFQMTTDVNHVAVMVQGFLVAYWITFTVFTFVSFNRVSQKMRLEVLNLPLFKSAHSLVQANWARALALCVAFPFCPLVLLASCTKQFVRGRRGLNASSGLLTPRVQSFVQHALAWDWIKVTGLVYIMAAALITFRICPVFLNILLAWMSAIMASLNYWLICAATLCMGTCLFMLPPVPGPIIYPFAGIVLSDPDKCPYGFWWGCIISIVLSLVMKLAACTVQQKLIGEKLGSSLAVRRACGVHKPLMRAIEAILKRPGFSFGKCMILCGGPDWPTSVVAGILKLSLSQCLLGTLPVVLSIIPMALTGSFYLKRSESEVWTRTGNLMLFITTAVSAMFWVGIGWAIQDEYDQRGKELTRLREEFVELEWLDYRAARTAEYCHLRWSEIPRAVRAAYASGAMLAILVAQIFLWFSPRCFSPFMITDDIASLVWVGQNGFFRPLGIAGLALLVTSSAGLQTYRCWHRRWLRGPLAEANAALVAEELQWKAKRAKIARQVVETTMAMTTSISCAVDVPTLLSPRTSGGRSKSTAPHLKEVVVDHQGHMQSFSL